MAELSFYGGGFWCDQPYEKEPRQPQIKVTVAEKNLVKFTLTDTDASVANALRRIMLAEVPTIAIDIVNVEENESVLFDEFIAHRLGMLPLSCHNVGDIPPDGGFIEHAKCNCFDGCPSCTVTFKLNRGNDEDKVMNVTHFDMEEVASSQQPDVSDYNRVKVLPFRDPDLDEETDRRDNGIIICKLKKDQHLKMICQARKGIPRFHGKYSPVATCIYQYQPIINLNREMLDALTLDESIELVQCCPRKVFELDKDDHVQMERMMDCIFCNECVVKARDYGKRGMVEVKQNQNMWHFIVEGVTADGPRSMIDVVRASMRVLDYKLQEFMRDTWGDEITDVLPRVAGDPE